MRFLYLLFLLPLLSCSDVRRARYSTRELHNMMNQINVLPEFKEVAGHALDGAYVQYGPIQYVQKRDSPRHYLYGQFQLLTPTTPAIVKETYWVKFSRKKRKIILVQKGLKPRYVKGSATTVAAQ